MNLKDIGISYGDSPATMYPAQIVLPCAQDQAARHEETIAEIPVKYRAQVAKGNHPEVYLRSLPDWKYRKWTCSSHVILRERSTMVAILETIAASKEDWEQLIKDQWNEIEDKSWFADDSFTTGLGIYGFSLSVLHAEILERTCEFPTLSQGLRAQDMTGQAARKRDTIALADVISSVFTLYCCLSGPKFPPLFPWSSNTRCCKLIIYIRSLVHQRGKRAKKSKDSPSQVAGTPTVPGNCS